MFSSQLSRLLFASLFAMLSFACGGTDPAATDHGEGAQALGGRPHFIRNFTDVTFSGAELTVTFKEAGLSAGSTESVTLSATAMRTRIPTRRRSVE